MAFPGDDAEVLLHEHGPGQVDLRIALFKNVLDSRQVSDRGVGFAVADVEESVLNLVEPVHPALRNAELLDPILTGGFLLDGDDLILQVVGLADSAVVLSPRDYLARKEVGAREE